MQVPDSYSLDDLIALALEDRLIDAFVRFPDHIDLTMGDTRLRLSLPRACTFLNGVLRGRSWHRGPADRAPVRPIPLFPARTLDDLLAYARLLGLIEGFDRDTAAGTVRLHLRACSLPMPEDDAFAFLADCIHETLLRMNRTPGEGTVREPAVAGRAARPFNARGRAGGEPRWT